MEKEEIKKILEDNIKLISDGIDYLNSDECIKNREEYEKWQEKNRP